MRRIITVTALLVVASAGLATAQTRRAADEKQIIANERKINEAFAKGDGAAFKALLAPGSFVQESMGVMKAVDIIPMFGQAKFESWNIDQSQVHFIDANTAIHTYRWTGKGTFMGQPMPNEVRATSVWVKRGGKWLGLFHQETPVK